MDGPFKSLRPWLQRPFDFWEYLGAVVPRVRIQMSPIPALHPLSLLTVDFAAAGLLYRFASPSLGLLVALAGTLLLCGLVYEWSQSPPRQNDLGPLR